jgi:hypothetical protein
MTLAWILMPLGLLLTLIGLAMIGAQVNKHRIRPASPAAWVFRAGALLVGLALLLGRSDSVLAMLAQLIGALLVGAAVVTLNHEWVQQAEARLGSPYHFKPTSDMLLLFFATLLNVFIAIIGLAQDAEWAVSAELLLVGLSGLLAWRVYTAPEREQSGFDALHSLTAQLFAAGLLLLVIGSSVGG